MSKEDLIRRCNEVRDELSPQANTATRIGQLLSDIVEELGGGNKESLTLKLDGVTTTQYNGEEESSVNISPETINAARKAQAGNFYTNGLSAHYFDIGAIRGVNDSTYIPLIKMTSVNNGKMDIIFSVGSREWGYSDNFYGKFRFTSRSGRHAFDCIEFYDASGKCAMEDFVYEAIGSTVTIYRKGRSNITGNYFYTSIEGHNNDGYTTHIFYTSNVNVKANERTASAVSLTDQVVVTDRRHSATMTNVEDSRNIDSFAKTNGSGVYSINSSVLPSDTTKQERVLIQSYRGEYKVLQILIGKDGIHVREFDRELTTQEQWAEL